VKKRPVEEQKVLNDANGAFNPRVEEEPSKPIEVKKVKVKGKKAKKKKKDVQRNAPGNQSRSQPQGYYKDPHDYHR